MAAPTPTAPRSWTLVQGRWLKAMAVSGAEIAPGEQVLAVEHTAVARAAAVVQQSMDRIRQLEDQVRALSAAAELNTRRPGHDLTGAECEALWQFITYMPAEDPDRLYSLLDSAREKLRPTPRKDVTL